MVVVIVVVMWSYGITGTKLTGKIVARDIVDG